MDARGGGSSDNERRAFESVPRFRKQPRSRVSSSRRSGEKELIPWDVTVSWHRPLATGVEKKKEEKRNSPRYNLIGKNR